MKARPEATFRFAAPLRAALTRFAFLSLVGLCFVLMLLSKAEVVVIERTRMAVLDALAPAFEAISQPTDYITNSILDMRQLVHIREENARLRTEVERLGQWQEVARRLDGENQALRALLSVVPDPPVHFATARVLADSGGAFVRQLLVGAGSEQGIGRGHVAMTGEGMVGRVSEVGARTARVLLINDLNSRIPVVVESSHARAVLAGDNSPMLRLLYLARDAHAAPGDRVVTSGDGGNLPAGLPIGVIASNDEHGVLVQPLVDWTRLEYVRILDYGLGTILPTPPPAPPAPARTAHRAGAAGG